MTTKVGFDLTIQRGRDPKDFELPLRRDLREYLALE